MSLEVRIEVTFGEKEGSIRERTQEAPGNVPYLDPDACCVDVFTL